jgi:putative tributyrin esterase
MIRAPMNHAQQPSGRILLAGLLVLGSGCRQKQAEQEADRPRLAPSVRLCDVRFHSPALNREMPYRAMLPSNIGPAQKLPVVYLLHGAGGGFRDWSNYSDVARFAPAGLILVMPEGGSSYYTNALDPPQDRYEDYITSDLISDVEHRFPAAPGRTNRAIVGLSMGGFGAVKIGLRRSDLFSFVGGLSSAIDVPRRAFSIRRFGQSRRFHSIFGGGGSETRRENDPFVLVGWASPKTAPYLFLTCGEQEGLLPANREFAALLAQHHFRYQFDTMRGGHDWNQWNAWLPVLFASLIEHLSAKN